MSKITGETKASKRKVLEPISNSIPEKVQKTVPIETGSSEKVFASPASNTWNFKITSWNVAGLRAFARKPDGMSFLQGDNADIICLQETKCLPSEIPDEAKFVGYYGYWHGQPGGHAGVALYSKIMPNEVTRGLNDTEMDKEARLITGEFTKFYVVCVYVPNSGRGLVTLQKRLKWNTLFQQYLNELNKKKPVIICGDMNVSHEEIDLANPRANAKNAGFTIEERTGMNDMLNEGFIDTFRKLYPNKIGFYTFWTYMANARAKNVGWRLDYFIMSTILERNLIDNVIHSNIKGSDHCPITLFLDI